MERARTAEIVQGLERDASRLKNIDANLHNNIERLAAEGTEAERQQAECRERIDSLTDELKGLHQGRETLAAEQDQRRQHWAAANTQNRELQENISRLQRQLNEQREHRTSLEVRISELKLRPSTFANACRRSITAMSRLWDRPTKPSTKRPRNSASTSCVSPLHRLGTVHLGVLEEHKEQQERYDFLRQQRDDLVIAAEGPKKDPQLD